jgi:hypothetical protein
MTMTLAEYVVNHIERGACTCGSCLDAPPNPETRQPTGHTADMFFFKVKTHNNPSADVLRVLIESEMPLLLDGKEHSYIEIGAGIGDQGAALCLIGLAQLLGLGKAITPNAFGDLLPNDLKKQMAGRGMITFRANQVQKEE